jgi:hypothetical protein
MLPMRSLISMLGASRLQKLAATITPPVKPSMPSSHLREALPKKNTRMSPQR